MGILGTLNTMNVSDLLQFLGAGRKTGTLKLSRGSIVKEIYLEDGLIVGSSSNDPREYLGLVLLHYGKIEELHLQAAMEVQRESGGRLGEILSLRGLVRQGDVIEVLRTRTLEIIYDLFIWDEAQFEFFDNAPPPHDLIRIQVEATSVIMDGIYRIDEWARYRAVIPSDRTRFELTRGWAQSHNTIREIREVLFHGATSRSFFIRRSNSNMKGWAQRKVSCSRASTANQTSNRSSQSAHSAKPTACG